ncbi:MAG TPA: hypothetical protein DCM62_05725 [Bacteroidales bacterium]|nr:hypothetical protein [Bacteroidales bacterium]
MKHLKKLFTHLVSFLLIVVIAILSLLPFRVLYLISDFIGFLLCDIIKYRKKVVLSNLNKAFPHNTLETNLEIARKFYKHLSDIIFETIALITASRKTIKRRIILTPESKELLGMYHAQGRSAIMALGHFGNWEWMGPAINLVNDGQLIAAYRRQRLKLLDYFLRKIRMRFYKVLVPSEHLIRKMVSMKTAKQPAVFALLADQWPPTGSAHWVHFLGQDTPFFTGPEKLGKKLDYAVLFCSIRKMQRGRYSMSVFELALNPRSEPEMAITNSYASMLEQEILQRPEFWLWSHRRWKWQRPTEHAVQE